MHPFGNPENKNDTDDQQASPNLSLSFSQTPTPSRAQSIENAPIVANPVQGQQCSWNFPPSNFGNIDQIEAQLGSDEADSVEQLFEEWIQWNPSDSSSTDMTQAVTQSRDNRQNNLDHVLDTALPMNSLLSNSDDMGHLENQREDNAPNLQNHVSESTSASHSSSSSGLPNDISDNTDDLLANYLTKIKLTPFEKLADARFSVPNFFPIKKITTAQKAKLQKSEYYDKLEKHDMALICHLRISPKEYLWAKNQNFAGYTAFKADESNSGPFTKDHVKNVCHLEGPAVNKIYDAFALMGWIQRIKR